MEDLTRRGAMCRYYLNFFFSLQRLSESSCPKLERVLKTAVALEELGLRPGDKERVPYAVMRRCLKDQDRSECDGGARVIERAGQLPPRGCMDNGRHLWICK